MQDPLNVSLMDDELLAEVELTTALIIAATESEHALTPLQVDHLLTLGPRVPAPRRCDDSRLVACHGPA